MSAGGRSTTATVPDVCCVGNCTVVLLEWQGAHAPWRKQTKEDTCVLSLDFAYQRSGHRMKNLWSMCPLIASSSKVGTTEISMTVSFVWSTPFYSHQQQVYAVSWSRKNSHRRGDRPSGESSDSANETTRTPPLTSVRWWLRLCDKSHPLHH